MLDESTVKEKIREFFEQNYAAMQLETGYGLAEDVRQEALQQVLMYFTKLRDVAEKVTETEVKLTLPDQRTPARRRFTIEGVVDIVTENDETWMYDIKTHDPDYVRAYKQFYEKQLNVYAHIWQSIRGNDLDHTAIISTAFPKPLKEALDQKDVSKIMYWVQQWQPVIEMPFDPGSVQETIQDFGRIVDDIEDRRFEPPPLETLKKDLEGTRQRFAVRVCRNCDVRFSCASYREYAVTTNSRVQGNYKKYFYEPPVPAEEQQAWLSGNLDATTNI